MFPFFSSAKGPPQLTYGKPIDFNADVPIFPPFAMMLTIISSQIIRKLTGRSLAFLPAICRPKSVRAAFLAVMLAVTKFIVLDSAGGELQKSGSGTLFVPVNGLATGGIYAYTRNPMYCGLIFLAIPSLSCVIDSAWPVILSPITWCYLNFVVIAAEEELLAETFGASFDAYCAEVPRWLIC